MRVVFMGTPKFAEICLEGLMGAAVAGHINAEIVAVVTQPDRPGGRGKRLQASPVKQYAEMMNIPILQPEKIKAPENIAQLQALEADIFIVAAYGQILSQKILDMPACGAINVHASLLPKYRGASPIQQAIADGETTTGITIIQMDKGMDTGDMILKREIAIDPDDTGGSLHDKLAVLGPQVLLDALRLISDGKAVREPQNNNLATHAPLITKQMAHIDWNKSSVAIVNMIRAYNPFPGAFTKLGDSQIKIWQAAIADSKQPKEVSPTPNIPGTILQACPKDGIIVATADGAIRIIELTPPNAKKMYAADYVRGYKEVQLCIFH